MEAMPTYSQLWKSLLPLYEPREAQAIVRTLLDDRFGLTLTGIFTGALEHLDEKQNTLLMTDMNRVRKGEPVQYVTGHAWFAGRQFSVGPGVLIPRPETEGLIEVTDRHLKKISSVRAASDKQPVRLLDIGTGSGCIAITIAANHPEVSVTAWDISNVALDCARRNAQALGAAVTFRQQDALTPPDDNDRWEVIVSNPPYVLERERSEMERNVLDYEPATALFVPDTDPLRFYRAITRYARHALCRGGLLAFEVNTAYADEVSRLLSSSDFQNIMIHKDPYNRPRVVEGLLP